MGSKFPPRKCPRFAQQHIPVDLTRVCQLKPGTLEFIADKARVTLFSGTEARLVFETDRPNRVRVRPSLASHVVSRFRAGGRERNARWRRRPRGLWP